MKLHVYSSRCGHRDAALSASRAAIELPLRMLPSSIPGAGRCPVLALNVRLSATLFDTGRCPPRHLQDTGKDSSATSAVASSMAPDMAAHRIRQLRAAGEADARIFSHPSNPEIRERSPSFFFCGARRSAPLHVICSGIRLSGGDHESPSALQPACFCHRHGGPVWGRLRRARVTRFQPAPRTPRAAGAASLRRGAFRS
jgi:hypothetical protein